MCCNHLNRREFIGITAAGVAGAGASLPFSKSFSSPFQSADEKTEWDPDKPLHVAARQLKVQPVLMYKISERKELSSWKAWGKVQNESAALEEMEIISKELNGLSQKANFPLQILPLIKVKSIEETSKIHDGDHDVVLLYAASGAGSMLEACLSKTKNNIIFVRHRSGTVYYWYEALSVRYLSADEIDLKQINAPNPKSASIHDVVVDDYNELLWRLHALYGVKNFLGTRIVALGGAWGKYSPEAPELAKIRHNIEIIDVTYDEMERRIKNARLDNNLVLSAQRWTEKYLALPHTTLTTDSKFIVNAFLLYKIFKDLMIENNATAFTIKSCMSTIIRMSETTACLALGLLNDEGSLAFCESDFVVIPSGILLHYISGKPVFLHNSTFPHDAIVTCAHCTAPRRMDGRNYDPVNVVTHYETEYGASPKVEIPLGQEVTFIDPEYSTGRWVGFKGNVESNPFYEICRSQQDVRVQGDWKKLIKEVRDSHWMMAYGDHLKELEYAARKIGIRLEGI